MRQERDSLGDLQLSDDTYFGIGTARLINAAAVAGPDFPHEIPQNILRVRQAQAIAFGRNKTWSNIVASAVEKAADRIVKDDRLMTESLKVRPQHGGGARSVILNVDEILANVALEELGSAKGQYHIVAPLFQSDRGVRPLETYLTAVHITLIKELTTMADVSNSLALALKSQERALAKQGTLVQIQFQDVGISNLGAEFSRLHASLLRSRQQMEWFRSCLIPCWLGPADALLALRELVGIDIAVNQTVHDFPWNVDLYVGLSATLKAAAVTLLHFCNRMRLMIGVTKEINVPMLRANPAFNPAGNEFLIPDTVSQLVFLIMGADAAIVAATTAAVDGAAAYVPVFSSQLVWSAKWLTASLQLLEANFVAELTGNAAPGAKSIAATPMQAELLIPVLGYDRAVQVARIAALTEKPVRTVVHKMKLLTEDQLDQHLPLAAEDEA